MLPDTDIHRNCIQFQRRSQGRQRWYDVRYQDKPYEKPDGTIRTLADDSILIGHVEPRGAFGKVTSYEARIDNATGIGKTRLKAVDDALRQLGR